MKTWRERIVEARERGKFGNEDMKEWMNYRTCLVGEVQARYWGPGYNACRWMDLNGHDGAGFQEGVQRALLRNDFRFLEDRLDAIEDRALQLKREATDA